MISKLHNHILAEGQPGNFGGESDDGFLEYVVEIGRNEPTTRQSCTAISKVGAVGIKFFRRTGDIATFAALGVGVLGAAFKESRIALGKFA